MLKKVLLLSAIISINVLIGVETKADIPILCHGTEGSCVGSTKWWVEYDCLSWECNGWWPMDHTCMICETRIGQ